MLPAIVISDPELTVGLPAPLTAATGMDALAHCLEAYCAPGYHPMAEGIAVEGLRLVKDWLPAAVADGGNLEARAHMLAAASMGSTAFQKGLGAIHSLSHPVGALYDTHHGLTNAVVMPYVLVFNRAAIEDRLTRLAAWLELPDPSFQSVLDWVLGLREKFDMPHTLAAMGVTDARLDELSEMAPLTEVPRANARAGVARRCRAVCVLALLALAACSPARTLEAYRVLDDVAAGAGPSTLKEITPAPGRAAIRYLVDGRAYAADLYRPGEAARAALVLVPGAAERGKDDPRLIAFATSLARARFLVLVPDIESLRALTIGPEDAGRIADALRHLSQRGDVPKPGALGLVAVSYAAGPAILAALALDLRARVRFLLAIGGYYDMEAAVTFFTTGRYRASPQAPWRHMTPNAYGKWVFLRANAGRLESARDRWLLAAMARRKLADLAAPLDDLAARLGPEGRSVHELLVNHDPEAVPALIAALPERVLDDMAALDLSRADLRPRRRDHSLYREPGLGRRRAPGPGHAVPGRQPVPRRARPRRPPGRPAPARRHLSPAHAPGPGLGPRGRSRGAHLDPGRPARGFWFDDDFDVAVKGL
jgi:hypothetical protein